MKKGCALFMAFLGGLGLFLVMVLSLFSGMQGKAAKKGAQAGYGLPLFVTDEMMEAFFEGQETYGIPVSSGLAQLIAESGFGTHGPNGDLGQGLSGLAYDYKNLFGIKYHSGDSHAVGAVNLMTGEQTGNGGGYTIVAGFSVYPDYTACIYQRAKMLMGPVYYSHISPYFNPNDGSYTKEQAKSFIAGIREAGWATDTAYVQHCVAHMDIYDLYQFDRMDWEAYQAGKVSGDIVYDGTVTPEMERIVRIARADQGTYPCTPDMCAAWVTGVYEAAGVTPPHGNAIDMWNNYKQTGSTSMEGIPPGAVVCGSGVGYMGALYGHVGIYLGDGQVANNIGRHSIESLEDWCAWQTATCQGHTGWIGWVYPGG